MKLRLGVTTIETNRDRDQDQLLKLVKIILTVETRLFFISVEIFKIETFQWWCRDKIEISQSRLLRQAFWNCQDFLDCRDLLFASVELESLDQDHVEANQDPQACMKQKRTVSFF